VGQSNLLPPSFPFKNRGKFAAIQIRFNSPLESVNLLPGPETLHRGSVVLQERRMFASRLNQGFFQIVRSFDFWS